MTTTIRATIGHTPRPDRLEILEDHVVTIDDEGTIVTVEPATDDTADISLGPDALLLPGLIDTHIHAPQWPQLGTGLDLPLETWLFDYTFPLEARCADETFARSVWTSMVPELLRNGTTTAVYYSSIHERATTALAEACVEHGQRAFVGRVAMDHPDGTPEYYRDSSASAAVDASARSVEAVRRVDDGRGLVHPVITPRFIPACTDAALEGLGELASSSDALVQTHCSEGDWEHQHVIERTGTTDTSALDAFGLIRDHAVLAHATHLTDDDLTLLIRRGAGVSHCPLSNSYFANAVFPARRNLAAGLRVGLGTDIGAGATASMLAQCEHAVTSSRMLADGVDVTRPPDQRGVDDSAIDITTAFWMATAGGAELLGIAAGLIAPGRAFDAFVVDLGRLGTWPELDGWERVFEKVVRRAGPAQIDRVWVAGREVVSG
ncbi:MAG: amidohydrolase family protein [Acidimicrobiales bacterium]